MPSRQLIKMHGKGRRTRHTDIEMEPPKTHARKTWGLGDGKKAPHLDFHDKSVKGGSEAAFVAGSEGGSEGGFKACSGGFFAGFFSSEAP